LRARTIREKGPRRDPAVRDLGVVVVGEHVHVTKSLKCARVTLSFRREEEVLTAALECEECGAPIRLERETTTHAEASERAGVLRWRALDAKGVPAGPWEYAPLGKGVSRLIA